jgi:hypothetical protein
MAVKCPLRSNVKSRRRLISLGLRYKRPGLWLRRAIAACPASWDADPSRTGQSYSRRSQASVQSSRKVERRPNRPSDRWLRYDKARTSAGLTSLREPVGRIRGTKPEFVPSKPKSNVPALIVVPTAQYWPTTLPPVKTELHTRPNFLSTRYYESAERDSADTRGVRLRNPKSKLRAIRQSPRSRLAPTAPPLTRCQT